LPSSMIAMIHALAATVGSHEVLAQRRTRRLSVQHNLNRDSPDLPGVVDVGSSRAAPEEKAPVRARTRTAPGPARVEVDQARFAVRQIDRWQDGGVWVTRGPRHGAGNGVATPIQEGVPNHGPRDDGSRVAYRTQRCTARLGERPVGRGHVPAVQAMSRAIGFVVVRRRAALRRRRRVAVPNRTAPMSVGTAGTVHLATTRRPARVGRPPGQWPVDTGHSASDGVGGTAAGGRGWHG